DGLEIVARPPRRQTLGLYATRRRGSDARPYRTLLRRVDPIQGSCDCADFLRSSLGLCKHLLAVLEDVASRPQALEAAGREPAPSASLLWHPIRPLSGPGDWLEQVRWIGGAPDRSLRRWLRRVHGSGWSPEVPRDPERRRELVDALLVSVGHGQDDPAL